MVRTWHERVSTCGSIVLLFAADDRRNLVLTRPLAGVDSIGLAECSIVTESSLAGCWTELTSILSDSTVSETGFTLLSPYQDFISPVTVTAGLEKMEPSSQSPRATTPSSLPASKTLSTGSTSTTSNVAPMVTQNGALAGVVVIAGALAL